MTAATTSSEKVSPARRTLRQVGEQWPSLRGRKVRAVLKRICGEPVRQKGSHTWFRSPITGDAFLYGFHDNAEIPGGIVRRILVVDVGLTTEQARREAR